MWIFGPLPCSTISPVTVTPARACASVVTVSPSISSRAGRVIVSPASPVRRLTVKVSPTPTLCCVPPALTTAYTTDSSIQYLCPARTTGTGPSAGRVAGRRGPPGGGRRSAATRPAYPSPRVLVERGPRAESAREPARDGGTGVLPQAGGPAGRDAARRRRGRATGGAASVAGSATGRGATATGDSGSASATGGTTGPGSASGSSTARSSSTGSAADGSATGS